MRDSDDDIVRLLFSIPLGSHGRLAQQVIVASVAGGFYLAISQFMYLFRIRMKRLG
jgi:hypothetical protein